MSGDGRRQGYEAKKQRLAAQLAEAAGPVGLGKSTSNLFRDRPAAGKRLLDVRDFDQVLAIDAAEGWIEVEGMAPYSTVVDAALAQGVMPAVVPELRSITVGGAAAGVAIESSSFRYGLMHESILEMDVLVGDGRVLTCRPDNDASDLFFGLPNSYGTLGYALRLKVRAVPVRPYVRLSHRGYGDAETFFRALAVAAETGIDFLDGTAFAPDRLYLTQGAFVDEAPWVSDYGYQHIYYRSIPEKETDYLGVCDYIWRWDTDWFWCSKNLYAQNPLVRRLLGRSRLNSPTYTRIMRRASRWRLSERVERLTGRHGESVIQDVDIPIERAPEFLAFLFREIGIRPIWICPVRSPSPEARFPLYPLEPGVLYINFGFWDRIVTSSPHPKGHFNRLVERKVAEMGGIKSLYSDSYYGREEFWTIYGKPVYDRLKAKYDPQGRLRDLYAKCVERM
ncbi:MAG: FAD-binding oxidoreductase [Chromatiaceae bacterium]|jgi:FAD/FMN-containing dehydrogenase|nr:FAD-binding oxidoreductase [Chromatiaceae bacterium]